jgi:2-polyprenyl-3-methyl-5-hydroxy-6-metoxy-1,4-benzoquinol methylase
VPGAVGKPEDKAGRAHWEGIWRKNDAARLQPLGPVDRRLAVAFRDAIEQHSTYGNRLLEVGCARSRFLPWFATNLGVEVAGLDYSEQGCEQARSILESAGVEGEIVCADLFDPPPGFLTSFDYVLSIGLVEHFSDPAVCLRALSGFLKEGGLLITLIPNVIGISGGLQRLINRPVYEMHMRLGPAALAAASQAAGLKVIRSEYLLSTNFGVNNTVGLEGTRGHLWKSLLVRGLTRMSGQLLRLEERFARSIPPSRLASPYVLCLASKAPVS